MPPYRHLAPDRGPWTPGILYIPRPYASRTRATPVCVVFAPPRPISRAARRESLQCFPKCLAALTGCAERKPPCFSQRRRGAHHGTIHLSRERPASFHAPREAGVALALRERTAGRRGSSPKGSHETSPRATDDAPSAHAAALYGSSNRRKPSGSMPARRYGWGLPRLPSLGRAHIARRAPKTPSFEPNRIPDRTPCRDAYRADAPQAVEPARGLVPKRRPAAPHGRARGRSRRGPAARTVPYRTHKNSCNNCIRYIATFSLYTLYKYGEPYPPY